MKLILNSLQIVCLSLLLTSCGNEVADENDPVTARPVKVTQVQLANGAGKKQFPAIVEPNYTAKLAFRVNGELSKLHVVAGMKVKQGQVLAELDDKDFVLHVRQAQAKYDLSESQFKRSQQLFKEQLIASSMFDEAKAQLDIAAAQLEAAKTNLKYTQVKAPFDGMIAQVHVETFEFVQAKQPILQLQGRDSIDIAIQVPEQLMAKLPNVDHKIDYQPILVLDSKPDRKYTVEIKEFDIAPNPATQSYKAVFTMESPKDINVFPGMTGSLFVELNQILGVDDDLFSVPSAAIFRPNSHADVDSQFVYKLTKQLTTELVEVEVIKVNQDSTLIKAKQANLKAGDNIVAAGTHLISAGQAVTIWSREGGL